MSGRGARAIVPDMERTIIHIIGGDSRSRAEQARVAFALGHHAEVYGSLEELIERPPPEGVLLAVEDTVSGGADMLIHELAKAGLWLPVVITARQCRIESAVDAIRAGAFDYLALPLEMNSFARRLARIVAEAGPQVEERRRQVEARRLIATLSRREHEVLRCLTAGQANKLIARDLGISPRTVEIHRANMMAKLGAGHPADAVRLWIDGQCDRPAPDLSSAPDPQVAPAGARVIEPLRPPVGTATEELPELRRYRQ